MISYELARQLKEAGFPQRGLWGIVYLTEKVSYSKEEARMSTYRNSTMHVYEDDGLSEPDRCEVRIDSGSIVISYQDDDGTPIIYEGKEVEPGHFKLESQKVSGRATLHRFAEEPLLEGSWIEDEYEGMWRVELEE